MMKAIAMILWWIFCIAFDSVRTQFFQPPSSARCINPNQRPGSCVALVDCQTLMSVLNRKSLRSIDVEFVKASACIGGYGAGPNVCCTSDTGYAAPPFGGDYFWDSPPTERTILSPINDFNGFNAPAPRRSTTREQMQTPTRRAGGRRDVTSGRTSNMMGSSTSTGTSTLLPEIPVCGGVTIQNKIYGGADTDLHEFPWMALFEYRRKTGDVSTNCAGSLISRRYVITAAHCVKGAIERRLGQPIAVRLGEHDLNSQYDCNQFGCAPEAVRVGIDEIIAHEEYRDRSSNKENDIALVRLDRNVRFSDTVSPICLPSAVKSGQRPRSGSQLTVVGWGRTLQQAQSPIKQKLNVSLVDQQQCQRRFRERKVKIADSQVCAGGTFAQDSCDGDSGGPLMNFDSGVWVLEGIVSFGFKCGLKDWPAVHTRVSTYNNWIRSKLRA